jgi:hypothetical protein
MSLVSPLKVQNTLFFKFVREMLFSKEYSLTVDHEYPDFFHYHTLFEMGGLDEGYEANIPLATVLSIDGVLLMDEDSAYTTNNACFNLSGSKLMLRLDNSLKQIL